MSTKPKLERKKIEIIKAADFWCGGGGTSTGFVQACKEMGLPFDLTGVNHWEIAVQTHSTNHPYARHFCKAVDTLIPKRLYPKGYLRLLMASPECIGHSKARGGKPTTEQKRADAKDIERWVENLYIEDILLENVEEFIDWGPLGKDGKPLKSKKGEYFRKFIEFLQITHKVEWRILNCADYGDATTRRRFFLIARRGKNKKIIFPEPTHASRAVLARRQPDLFNPEKELKPWVPAREIINWKLKGKNVFGRKKPLSENTMKRIYAGLRKFSGIDVPERKIFVVKSLFDLFSKEKKKKLKKQKVLELRIEDFAKILKKKDEVIVPDYEKIVRDESGEIVEHFQSPSPEQLENLRAEKQKPVDEIYVKSPIKIDFTKFNPFILQNEGFFRGNSAGRSVNEPIPTVTQRGGGAVVEPFVMGTGGRQLEPKSIEQPMPTIMTDHRFNLFEPYIVNLKGTERRMRSIDEPTFTQTASPNQQMLIQPYLVNLENASNTSNSMCRDLSEPVPTICGKGMLGIVEGYLVKYHGNETGAHDLGEPLSTLTTKDRLGVVEPVLIPCHHGEGDKRAHSLSEPVPTITNVDGMGIAEPFLTQLFGGRTAVSIENPVPAITANYEHYGLAEPFLVKFNNNQDARDLDEPLDTITTKEKIGIGQPFMIQFYGERDGQKPRTRSVNEPVWTVTPQVRMGIIEPFLVKVEDYKGKVIHGLLLLELGAILVINYRMLHQTELAAAMSFPPDYFFAGKREDQVRQIGNAVPVKTAKALIKALLEN
jgi:DNA (cytosine-5)-methyltransferase 1